jgi:uncharacterized protein (DUF2236 family)
MDGERLLRRDRGIREMRAPTGMRTRGTGVAWRLQREIVLLAAWAPAILLQLAHPLVARGVADHSSFRDERWGRLRRFHSTLDAMLRLAFGTEADVRAGAARINAIHDRVHGRLPEAAGRFPAGTRYSAHDPELLAWVHATLVDMNIRVYELYVETLSPEDRDRYCAEATRIEPLLGIPEGYLPRRFAELQARINAALASGEIEVTPVARELARDVVYPPLPLVAAPGAWFMRLPAIGLLPPVIRAGYGWRWRPRDERMLRLTARLVRTVLRLTPPLLRHWPAARAAARRNRSAAARCPISPAERPAPAGRGHGRDAARSA